jgi:hypothetical protein
MSKNQTHAFIISALGEVQWSDSSPSPLTERIPGTHWIAKCVGSRATFDAVRKRKQFVLILGIENGFLGHSVHNLVTIPILCPTSSLISAGLSSVTLD